MYTTVGRLSTDGTKSPSWHLPCIPTRAMIVVCAWCQAEGRPSFLAEREPLEDKTSTHTACEHHRAELLEELRRIEGSDAAA
jgi:hypothetical protein